MSYHASLLDMAHPLLGVSVGMCTELLVQHCFSAEFGRRITAVMLAVMILTMSSLVGFFFLLSSCFGNGDPSVLIGTKVC